MINIGIIVGHGNTGCAFIDGPSAKRFGGFYKQAFDDVGEEVHGVCIWKGDKFKSIFRDKWKLFCLLFYKLILMDRIRYNLFSLKLGEWTLGSRDKWKVIECVLSLVLQVYPHG